MKQIIRFRWLIAGLWIAIALSLFFFAPNLQQLVAEKGQITVPDGYPSQEAQQLIEKLSSDGKHVASAVLVFHDEAGIDQNEKDEIISAIHDLKDNSHTLGVSDILDFTEDPRIEDQTVSEDGTTILIPFNLSLKNKEVNEARQQIYDSIHDISIDHQLTGEVFIQQDIITNSEEGLEKTTYITVILILVILFAVFKSFIAPLIPLMTIGISYLVSEGIVAILADTVHFPISTFTQIFMIAVMFGIGTDYCILLISRFKEEIHRHESIKDAVVATYRSAGKTVYFAGLAVLVGFSIIGLSTFSLYQSAVAVAIGVLVVLVALATLVPFFLVILGTKLFWPFHKKVEHKESKIWGMIGTFSWTRPLLAIVIMAIIITPALVFYNNEKSYDSLAEIGDQYDSVIAFNWIADSFGPSQAMPMTVVMETDKTIDSPEDFEAIDRMSNSISKIEGVDHVRSATRPAGDVIEDFLIKNQTDILADGIVQSTDGLKEIQTGLNEAATELKDSTPQLVDAESGVTELMKGTSEINNGVGEIGKALDEIEKGIRTGSKGTSEINSNLQSIKGSLDQTINGNKQLLEGYKSISNGLKEFGSTTVGHTEELSSLIQLLEASKGNVGTLYHKSIETAPELKQDPEYTATYKSAIRRIDGAIAGIKQTQEQLNGLTNINTTLKNDVIAPLNQLNDRFSQTIQGQEQITSGINELIAGMNQLQNGLNEAADGQGEVKNNVPSIQDSLSEIYGGQDKLKSAFTNMQSQLDELANGLNDTTDGLQQIDDGLTEVQGYLSDMDIDDDNPMVIIPEEALENDDFTEGIKPYLSEDKTIIKFDVVLSYSPYSKQAIETVETIENTVNQAKVDSIFENSDVKVGGISSTNKDLQNISDVDYNRTAILMIIGIFIILVILLKSIIMPIYLVGSLIITYLASMAFTEAIFIHAFGYDGLTWAVPFFAFVLLLALGVDYSIFLMDRFNEDKNGNIKTALLSAMKNMGTVIISAAIILGGTFAAMLPSGVLSLIQIASAVMIGLFLYAFVMLPLFTPVMVKLFGHANWWPFKR